MRCKIGDSKNNIPSHFKHPSNDSVVYFIPDAYHMLKLACNALADMEVFMNGENEPIKSKHIVEMHKIQSLECLKFANKLSNQHVEFERHKMHVKIAAQTLSSSVADAIDFLSIAHQPGYEDCSGTVKFIRTIDRLFDLLNSRNPFGKGFKHYSYYVGSSTSEQ